LTSIMKACLFCGAVEPRRAFQRVVPQWLLEHLELPGDDQTFHAVADSRTGEVVAQRTHSSFTFVDGRVCEKCNNGWMSRLEADAKPILVSLMDGLRVRSELATGERGILGKWTAKTLLTCTRRLVFGCAASTDAMAEDLLTSWRETGDRRPFVCWNDDGCRALYGQSFSL
jgi:hypothetical protein